MGKRAYVPPKLTVLGTVAALTLHHQPGLVVLHHSG